MQVEEVGSLKQDMKKELFIRTFEEDNYEQSCHDVLVIYMNSREEIFWQFCDAKAVPGKAFVVEKSAKDEPLFFGYRAGQEKVGGRLG